MQLPDKVYVIGFVVVVVLLLVWLLVRGRRAGCSGSGLSCGFTASTSAHNDSAALHWTSQAAQKQFRALTRCFGQADSVDPAKGGLAVWGASTVSKKHYCFDRVEVQDVGSSGNPPLTTFIDLDLPEYLETEVRKLSGGGQSGYSVQYNSASHQFIVNGPDMSTALVATAVAKRLITGQLRTEDAQSLVQPWILELQRSKNKKADMDAYAWEVCKYKNSLYLEYNNKEACGDSDKLPCGRASF